MAYTPHNFQPGDTLSAEIFNKLEQTVHDLGGAYIDFNDYMPISDLYTSMCSVVITETGCICTRKADSTATSYAFAFPLGRWGEIKEKTFYFNLTDLSTVENPGIEGLNMFLSSKKDYNLSYRLASLETTSTSGKYITIKRNMTVYNLTCADTDPIYLVVPMNTVSTNPGQSISFEMYSIRSEFVDGARGQGEYKDVKHYYTDNLRALTNCQYSKEEDGSYIISKKSGSSGTVYGCSIPLSTYGELKNKTIYVSAEDTGGLEIIGGFRLQFRTDASFNVNNGLSDLVYNFNQPNPFFKSCNISRLSWTCEDDQNIYLLLYLNHSVTGTPNTLKLSIYYLQKEWVEKAPGLEDYYTKEEVDNLIASGSGGGGGNIYSNYELFTIGDSLSAGNIWQTECAKRLGCVFRPELNTDPSHPTSVGGTTSQMNGNTSTFFRAMNLINYSGIQNLGDNAIILVQNNNDGAFDFNSNARAYKFDNEVEVTELTTEALAAIPEENRSLSTALKMIRYAPGRVLTVTTLPTVEGDVKLNIGWAGPGYSDYNIHVVPQATDEETLQYIYDRIIEYDFKGVYDESYDDGTISGVSFCSGQADVAYRPRVTFSDTDQTGMRCTITDVDSVPFATYRWFDSNDLTQWTDTSLWITPETSSGWKSAIEALIRAYPKAKIALLHFPQISQTQADFLMDNGSYDEVAFNAAISYTNDKMLERYNAISKLYKLKVIDLYSVFGVCATNLTTFYPASANVHPNKPGMLRIGELAAGAIQGWIK